MGRKLKKCAHGKNKYHCKECGGKGICVHGKRKYRCRDCKGAGICEHDRIRDDCFQCGGNRFCVHDLRRERCLECSGTGLCEEHKVRKEYCIPCKGSGICQHEKRRNRCVVCTPSCACQNCFFLFVPKSYHFYPYCFKCYCVLNPDAPIPKKYKLKEHHVNDRVKEAFPETKMVFNQSINGGCSQRRPDIFIDRLTHSIIIECDEHQHKGYSCENKRMMELFRDLGNRPLVMIRFNPDSYLNKDEKKIKGCFSSTKQKSLVINEAEFTRRIKSLLARVRFYTTRIPRREVTKIELFYDGYY